MISRTMQAGCLAAAGVFVATSVASAAIPEINGVSPLLRLPFDAFPDSNLTFTDNLASTGEVIFDENNFGDVNLDAGFFANRHNAWLSSDGGATAQPFQNQDAFVFSFDLNLDTNNASPRKEAGFIVSHPVTGTGQFMIASDNGEIATFSAFFPFNSNVVDDGNFEFGGIPYVLGTDVSVKMVYRPGVGINDPDAVVPIVAEVPASLEFIVNGISSGVIPLFNNENGFHDNTLVGFYVQNQVFPPDAATTSVNATFKNIQVFNLLDGDLDANGFVDILDLNIVLANWNTDGSADLRADTDLNGLVDILDLNVVLTDWNQGTPPAAGSVVPEPASLALLGLGAAGMLRRRHR